MCDPHPSVTISGRASSAETLKPPKQSPFRRKKLWEIEPHHHCSLVGTCLTLAELRQLARKAGIAAPNPLSDYELHVVFVNLVKEPGPVSRLVHKHLDRKYHRILQKLSKTPSLAEINAFWKEAMEAGNVAGAFWALHTHPQTSKDLLGQIFGEIHMLSHLAGASVRVDMQELARLRRRCGELEKQQAEAQNAARKRLIEQQATIDKLEQRLAKAVNSERALRDAEAQLTNYKRNPLVNQLVAQVNDLMTQKDAVQRRAIRMEEEAATWKRQAVDADARVRALALQLANSQQERNMLEATLALWLTPAANHADPAPAVVSASAPDLVGRCVLYVGGRPSQCSHFRTLVERCNGRFLHHDGGREDARAQLWDVVRHADAVLCPLDCISHDAVQRIKRLCERNTKPLVFLPRASLAAFTQGLNTLASESSRQCQG